MYRRLGKYGARWTGTGWHKLPVSWIRNVTCSLHGFLELTLPSDQRKASDPEAGHEPQEAEPAGGNPSALNSKAALVSFRRPSTSQVGDSSRLGHSRVDRANLVPLVPLKLGEARNGGHEHGDETEGYPERCESASFSPFAGKCAGCGAHSSSPNPPHLRDPWPAIALAD